MKPSVLSEDEVEQFVEKGFVLLREAFPAEVAARVRAFLWKEMGLSPDDPSGWTKPLIHLKHAYEGPPFTDSFTPRLCGALDDVMGPGRWNPKTTLGWWPVSFPGFEHPPWKEPETGWHIDGIQFHHHVNSPDQGLLPIFLFSDIAPGGGGTALDVGSHRIAARILHEAEPDGLHVQELGKRVAQHPFQQIVESQGRAGDVVLIHPFVRHARSMNTGSSVRFICNPCFVLKEPMNLKREDPAEYSPVERAIVEALATA